MGWRHHCGWISYWPTELLPGTISRKTLRPIVVIQYSSFRKSCDADQTGPTVGCHGRRATWTKWLWLVVVVDYRHCLASPRSALSPPPCLPVLGRLPTMASILLHHLQRIQTTHSIKTTRDTTIMNPNLNTTQRFTAETHSLPTVAILAIMNDTTTRTAEPMSLIVSETFGFSNAILSVFHSPSRHRLWWWSLRPAVCTICRIVGTSTHGHVWSINTNFCQLQRSRRRTRCIPCLVCRTEYSAIQRRNRGHFSRSRSKIWVPAGFHAKHGL